MTPRHEPRPPQDLLGRPLAPEDRELLELYARLHALAARKDLPPAVVMNCRQALVMLWNAAVDLGLMYEEPEID
jgi:hypothetical protein